MPLARRRMLELGLELEYSTRSVVEEGVGRHSVLRHLVHSWGHSSQGGVTLLLLAAEHHKWREGEQISPLGKMSIRGY